MGPPVSNHIRVRSSTYSQQPTPLDGTPSQNNWPNRTSSRNAGSDWRQQIESSSSSYNRRTPRDLYATPGASSMMSISPDNR